MTARAKRSRSRERRAARPTRAFPASSCTGGPPRFGSSGLLPRPRADALRAPPARRRTRTLSRP